MSNKSIRIHLECKECGKPKFVDVNTFGFLRWQQGMLIQRALPELSTDDRELLISRICPECWTKLFPPDKEEEDDGTWIDPAGGVHTGDDDDPAKMYE